MQQACRASCSGGGQARQHHRLEGSHPAGPCRGAGRQGLQGEAGPPRLRSAPDLSEGIWGAGVKPLEPSCQATPMLTGPTELPLCGCKWGLGLLPVSLDTFVSTARGHRDEGGPWRVWGVVTFWLLLLYILPGTQARFLNENGLR